MNFSFFLSAIEMNEEATTPNPSFQQTASGGR
jgi:hypothetical protein